MNTYTFRDTDLVFGVEGNQKKYTLKIRDLPSDEQPREKLVKFGPEALTTPELLAVILSTGTKKEGVLEMSQRVLKEYGEKTLINHRNPESLAQDLDIPLLKAVQIVASGELGRRFFQRNEYGQKTIRTAEDVFEYVGDMRTLPKEHLRGIYLNAHHRIVHDEVLSIGTINSNLIHPREVFKPAFEYGAVALILVHNHPSGVTTPSDADREITNQLLKAGKILGISILDHVVVGKDSFETVQADYE